MPVPHGAHAYHFNEMHKVTLYHNQTHYVIPKGETLAYFSFSLIAKRAVQGAYSDHAIVRHASVANKWKTVHMILHAGINGTVIQFNLTLQDKNDEEFKMSMSVEVDTRQEPKPNVTDIPKLEVDTIQSTSPSPEAEILFEDIPEERRFPRYKKQPFNSTPVELSENMILSLTNTSLLPREVQLSLQALDSALENGEITVKGHKLSKIALLRPFQNVYPWQKEETFALSHELGKKRLHEDSHSSQNTSMNWQKPYKDFTERRTEPSVVVQDLLHPQFDTAMEHREKEVKYTIQREVVQSVPKIPVDGNKEKTDNEKEEIDNQLKTKDAHADAPDVNVVHVRKLQAYVADYQGPLPWEKKKYFQDVLDVSMML